MAKPGLPAALKTVRRYALTIDLICGAVLAVVAMEISDTTVVVLGALAALVVLLSWIGIERLRARAHQGSALRP
jgi:hypothetical protein